MPILAHVFESITFRTAAASICAFLICVCLGPTVIKWLKSRYREPNLSHSDRLRELHSHKADTPTLGGLLVLGSIAGCTILWADLFNPLVFIILFCMVSLGILGSIDDLQKIREGSSGVSERTKLLAQVIISALAGSGLYWYVRDLPHGTSLTIPGWGYLLTIGIGLVPWVTFILTATSNAVNFTDGLDGLAGGCLVFAFAAAAVLSYVAGHAGLAAYFSVPYVAGCGEVTVVLGGATGAMLGFLWFNCHPAQVFMGDTGSLALGGLLGLGTLAARQELLLPLLGGVFVVEALSVVAQRYYFKSTGRRVFRCAPLHHHFQFAGLPESKIVVRFWIAEALCSLVAVATLKLR